jgi:hypothetical protein
VREHDSFSIASVSRHIARRREETIDVCGPTENRAIEALSVECLLQLTKR